MSRLIDDATKRNTWGSAAAVGVNQLEPQRSDLWYADFTNAILGVGDQLEVPSLLAVRKQLVQTVTFPDTKIKTELFRRESLPYMMPSWDEPLDALKMTFLLDTNTNAVSTMQDFLSKWHELVRAGRGFRSSGYKQDAHGNSPILLDGNYRSDYRFDCFLSFLRGSNNAETFSDLEAWQTLKLQQAYVASYRLSDLSYTNTTLVTLEACFYVEALEWLDTP
jgi:hypothetical protein